jgi:hypothetical protein
VEADERQGGLSTGQRGEVEAAGRWSYTCIQPNTAVQCSAVQCSAVQCSAVQCSAVQCSAVQCSAVQCSAMHEQVNGSIQMLPLSLLSHAVSRLCIAVQCSAVQFSAVQCPALQSPGRLRRVWPYRGTEEGRRPVDTASAHRRHHTGLPGPGTMQPGH